MKAQNAKEAITEVSYLINFIKAENAAQTEQIHELLTYIADIEEYYTTQYLKEFADKILYEIVNSSVGIVSNAPPEYYKGAKARQLEIIKIIGNLIGSDDNAE